MLWYGVCICHPFVSVGPTFIHNPKKKKKKNFKKIVTSQLILISTSHTVYRNS